jgi:ABC-type multidrug transport system ATPase subunit
MGFQQASEGEIKILGKPLLDDNIREQRARMAWLPQEISVDVETGRELLMLPFSFRQNRKHKPEEARITALLASLNLETELLDQKTDTLSGGQKQRLALASCLLLQKPLLLLDEPSSALDDASVDAVADALEAFPDLTLLSVSHDERWFRRMHRIIKIEEIQGTDGHNF